jgi:hypothetical protein
MAKLSETKLPGIAEGKTKVNSRMQLQRAGNNHQSIIDKQ